MRSMKTDEPKFTQFWRWTLITWIISHIGESSPPKMTCAGFRWRSVVAHWQGPGNMIVQERTFCDNRYRREPLQKFRYRVNNMTLRDNVSTGRVELLHEWLDVLHQVDSSLCPRLGNSPRSGIETVLNESRSSLRFVIWQFAWEEGSYMLSETKVKYYQPGVASLRPVQGCVHNGSTANFPNRKVRKVTLALLWNFQRIEHGISASVSGNTLDSGP